MLALDLCPHTRPLLLAERKCSVQRQMKNWTCTPVSERNIRKEVQLQKEMKCRERERYEKCQNEKRNEKDCEYQTLKK